MNRYLYDTLVALLILAVVAFADNGTENGRVVLEKDMAWHGSNVVTEHPAKPSPTPFILAMPSLKNYEQWFQFGAAVNPTSGTHQLRIYGDQTLLVDREPVVTKTDTGWKITFKPKQ